MNRNTARRTNGFTLVELCTCVSICAALVGQAVPALTKMRQERALRVTAATLADDMRFARSEANRTGESVYLRISGKGANACYVLHTGASSDCDCFSGRAVCTGADSAVLKAEWIKNPQIGLRSNAETLAFQFRQGLVTQTGSVEVNLDGGAGIKNVVAITGRVRNCYTGVKLSGMPKCA
ncbi:MAG: hypothetical protein EON93_01565 [Burkholderiales bacterium]|nr:MAG: hypothetical protein EON93_01565 [Burkholderiales bacterium]